MIYKTLPIDFFFNKPCLLAHILTLVANYCDLLSKTASKLYKTYQGGVNTRNKQNTAKMTS